MKNNEFREFVTKKTEEILLLCEDACDFNDEIIQKSIKLKSYINNNAFMTDYRGMDMLSVFKNMNNHINKKNYDLFKTQLNDIRDIMIYIAMFKEIIQLTKQDKLLNIKKIYELLIECHDSIISTSSGDDSDYNYDSVYRFKTSIYWDERPFIYENIAWCIPSKDNLKFLSRLLDEGHKILEWNCGLGFWSSLINNPNYIPCDIKIDDSKKFCKIYNRRINKALKKFLPTALITVWPPLSSCFMIEICDKFYEHGGEYFIYVGEGCQGATGGFKGDNFSEKWKFVENIKTCNFKTLEYDFMRIYKRRKYNDRKDLPGEDPYDLSQF